MFPLLKRRGGREKFYRLEGEGRKQFDPVLRWGGGGAQKVYPVRMGGGRKKFQTRYLEAPPPPPRN